MENAEVEQFFFNKLGFSGIFLCGSDLIHFPTSNILYDKLHIVHCENQEITCKMKVIKFSVKCRFSISSDLLSFCCLFRSVVLLLGCKSLLH